MIALIVAAVLVGFALVTVWLSPRLLAQRPWMLRHPVASLTAWCAALLVGAGALAAAVIAVVAGTLTSTAHAGAPVAIVVAVTGWLGLAVLGGGAMVVAAGRDTISDAARHNRDTLFSLPCSIRAIARRTDLRVCETAEIFACSLPGRRSTITVSTGLIARTTPAQLRAIVAHERAHLVLHHDLVLRLADLNVSCLPRSRAAQRLQRSSRLLVELIADDRAARTAGAVHLANALVTIGAATGDPSMELRAERVARQRWPIGTYRSSVPTLYPALVSAVAERRGVTTSAR